MIFIIFNIHKSQIEIFRSNLSINFNCFVVDVFIKRFDFFKSIYRDIIRFVNNVKKLNR